MSRCIGRPARLVAAFAAVLVLAATTALAQPAAGDYTDDTTLPAGRRGERVRQLLDAVSSGDPSRVEALVKEAFGGRFREIPIEQHQGALLGLYDQSRGIDFYGVRRYTPPGPADRVVVIAKNRLTGGWQGLSLTFDGTAEERITGVQIQPARPPKGLPAPPALTAEPARSELEGFLDRLAEAEAFSGTALLARNGEVLFEAARGVADRNHGVPMRLDSRLNLGSMNKMFTAVVIGQLVEPDPEGSVRCSFLSLPRPETLLPPPRNPPPPLRVKRCERRGDMEALFALLLVAVVPFLLLAVAFKVLFALVLLPFKVLGALAKGLLGLVAGVFGLAAGGIGLVFGLLVMLVVLVLLPLAPLLLLGGIVWLALKAFSPAARTA